MPNNKKNEDLFVKDLADYIRENIPKRYTVVSHKKILSHLLISTKEGLAYPRFDFMEQDISIGNWYEINPLISTGFKNNSEKTKIFVPKIIIEVKYEGTISHSVITYNQIAGKIKGIFNECKFYFFMRSGAKEPETLLKHGIQFDNIYLVTKASTGSQEGWPGKYRSGDLKRKHLKKKHVKESINQLVKDVKRDLKIGKLKLGN